MDAFIQFLIHWGYLGLFISALLAGSLVPFSSEVVLGALVIPATGLNPCVNETLDYHPDTGISAQWLERNFQCPIELLGHGSLPHRILGEHHH